MDWTIPKSYAKILLFFDICNSSLHFFAFFLHFFALTTGLQHTLLSLLGLATLAALLPLVTSAKPCGVQTPAAPLPAIGATHQHSRG